MAIDSHSHPPVPKRVITTNDRDGKSVVQQISPLHYRSYPGSKSSFSNLWTFDSVPTNDNEISHTETASQNCCYPIAKAGLDHRVDGGERTITGPGLGMVHAGGVSCRMNDLEPGGRSTPMHRTTSTDVVVLVSGKLVLVLEDGSETVLAKPGDSIIQRGTPHAWKNTSNSEWTRFMTIMVDAEPVVVDGKPLKNEFWHGSKTR
ncbi:hypothetical protein PENSPDRAFT_216458 [Peniophora sp. CONT]|nr:hypothetical protein PENSPDRAFT_216458 [Peniophora sp. CONT]